MGAFTSATCATNCVRLSRQGGGGTMHRKRNWFLLVVFFVLAVAAPGMAAASEGGGVELGTLLPLWSVIPFAGILLSIAIFPLVADEFWHHHYPKVSAFWALLFAIPFVLKYKGPAMHEILHIYILDYIPFIILLWALFTV
ncbi:MAG TPA: hypothetical protein ENK19_10490, partial [Acidobacteria bacterium]|nr:hypothetical protein [Acidobacteriota bacterium]